MTLLIMAVLGGNSSRSTTTVVTAVGAVATVVLVVLLAVLRQRYSAALHGEHQAAELQRHGVAAQRERQAAELQRQAVEMARRADERQAHYAKVMTEMSDMVGHVINVQLPAMLSGSEEVPPLPQTIADDSEVAALGNRIATAVADSAAKLREHLDDQIESSRLAVVTLARRVQASAHRIQEETTRMADRHPGDPDVLESSMRVDHAAAQQARHAQSVAVLCGEWPGQQWPQPLALVDVARAASSRIVAYQRVTVSGEPETAASASIVEPLIHLVAELLANATQSSPPTTQVLVTIRTVQRGAVIEIDDGGVGMEEHRLDQAREIISGKRLLRLGDLGEVPQTGMAVIGQYVRRHRFRVDLMPSPYGGVRAVILVPAEMVVSLEPGGISAFPEVTPPAAPVRPLASETPYTPPPSPPSPVSMPPTGSTSPTSPEPRVTRTSRREQAGAAASPASAPVTGSDGLPRRRSRRGESEQPLTGTEPSAESALPQQTPEQVGQWMAAYFQGSGSGSGSGSSSTPHSGSGSQADGPAEPMSRPDPGYGDSPSGGTDGPENESV
ncbi:MAG: hypothetical protein J2P25_07785 [Nocardiopsaceae bacterium]|nr:hypothetical protein [Nocardiopsaceae bacterium]